MTLFDAIQARSIRKETPHEKRDARKDHLHVASASAAVIISPSHSFGMRVSFLDRLKREADQQRAQAEAAERERDERDSRYTGQIEPRMKALTTYLEGLAATLQEVKPPILATMTIQGYGDIGCVPIWDYKVEHERRHRSFVLGMTWTMRVEPERSPEVRAEGSSRIQTLTSLFRQHNLGGIKEIQRTRQGELSIANFHARGYIKARMQAQISGEDPVLRMTFENANWLGASRRQFSWNEIDDSLFDRIARFVVREDDSLFTEELPEALRQRLRKEPENGKGKLPGEQLAQAPRQQATPPSPAAAPPQAPEAAAPPPRTATQPVAPAPAPIQERAKATAAMPPSRPDSPAQIPGIIPAPSPIEAGEVIEIDESKLGLWGDPDAPIVGLNREDDFARKAKAQAQAASTIGKAAGGSIAAPPPLAPGDVIPIDESKLGLHQHEPEDEFGAVARSIPSRPAAPAAPPRPSAAEPAPQPAAAPVAKPAPTPAMPQATPAPVAAPTARPAAPAPTAVAAATPAPASATPRPAVSGIATPAAPTKPAPAGPVAPTTPTAAPAAATAAMSEDDKEREAALFRLRMRAVMSRLRSEESGNSEG